MDTFIAWVGTFFAIVNAYYAWRRTQKLDGVWKILALNDPILTFVYKYDATLAWSVVAFANVALYGAGK